MIGMERRPGDRAGWSGRWSGFLPFVLLTGLALPAFAQTAQPGDPPAGGQSQAAQGSTNLTPNAPAAVNISPGATDMMSVAAPGTPSFTADTSRSGSATAGSTTATSGTASGSAIGGNSPLNPDCAIAGSDDPANMSFDTVGCGQ